MFLGGILMEFKKELLKIIESLEDESILKRIYLFVTVITRNRH